MSTLLTPESQLNDLETEELLKPLYDRPGFLIRRASQRSTSVFADICSEITLPQYGALLILTRIEGLDQKQLAKLLHVDQTNIGMIVRGLEKRGFIRREEQESDRRRKVLVLTQSGRLAYKAIEQKSAQAHQKFVQKLTAKEVSTLINLLKKIVD